MLAQEILLLILLLTEDVLSGSLPLLTGKMSLTMDIENDSVLITMTGPDTTWCVPLLSTPMS